jgi:RNA polymerase subunit RPABC4/transcription elongation factor Spt4
MALISCTKCNAQVSDKAKACPKCGTAVVLREKVKCVECGFEMDKGTPVCPNCGIEQGAKERFSVPPSAIPPVQKRKPTLPYLILGGALVVGIALIVILGNSTSYSPGPTPGNDESSSSAINSNYEVVPKPKTEAELKEELRKKEASHPTDYIGVEYTWRVNLIANTILEGTVSNKATISGFKNVTIRANFYSKTDMLLGKEDFTVMEFIKPGHNVPFRHKIVGWWEGATQSKYEILSAEAY